MEDYNRMLVLVTCRVRFNADVVSFGEIISVNFIVLRLSALKRSVWFLTDLVVERLDVADFLVGFMVNAICSNYFDRIFTVGGFLLHVSELHFLDGGSKVLIFQQVTESNSDKVDSYVLDELVVYFHAIVVPD